MTPAQIRKVIKQIEAHKAKVAKERDALREILDGIADLDDSFSRAIDDLDSAIDALSELV